MEKLVEEIYKSKYVIIESYSKIGLKKLLSHLNCYYDENLINCTELQLNRTFKLKNLNNEYKLMSNNIYYNHQPILFKDMINISFDRSYTDYYRYKSDLHLIVNSYEIRILKSRNLFLGDFIFE